MCGIVFGQSFTAEPINGRIYTVFQNQKTRGVQGFGLFDGEHNHLVKSVTEDRIIHWLAKDKNQTSMVLFHHRMPTSTINTRKANHPFPTKDYFGETEYVLIHNGHISNSSVLKIEHEKLGIKYHSELPDGSFTDSEALLWDFALVMEGKKDKLEARGGNAMMCLKLVKGRPVSLFFGRNTNPIYMTNDKDEFLLSSQGLPVKEMTGDKKEELVKTNTLYTRDFETHELTDKPFDFPGYVYKQPAYQRSHYDDDYEYTRPVNSGLSTNASTRRFLPSGTIPSHLKISKSERKRLKKAINPVQFQTSIFVPTHEELYNKCLVYLCASKGKFAEAHRLMDVDLSKYRAMDSTDDVIHTRITLVQAMEYLENDPLWEDNKSISPEWEALWQTS